MTNSELKLRTKKFSLLPEKLQKKIKINNWILQLRSYKSAIKNPQSEI